MHHSDGLALPRGEAKAASHSAAVERCCQARIRSLQDSKASNLNDWETKKRASQAFFNAMPDLTEYENIRDFIACVAQGMLLGAIQPIEGPKILYAAQVAVSALHARPKTPIQPQK